MLRDLLIIGVTGIVIGRAETVFQRNNLNHHNPPEPGECETLVSYCTTFIGAALLIGVTSLFWPRAMA